MKGKKVAKFLSWCSAWIEWRMRCHCGLEMRGVSGPEPTRTFAWLTNPHSLNIKKAAPRPQIT